MISKFHVLYVGQIDARQHRPRRHAPANERRLLPTSGCARCFATAKDRRPDHGTISALTSCGWPEHHFQREGYEGHPRT